MGKAEEGGGGDASKMLEAALEQMDGIISGMNCEQDAPLNSSQL